MAKSAFDFSSVFSDIENTIKVFMNSDTTKEVLQNMMVKSAEDNMYAKYESPAAVPYDRRYTMSNPDTFQVDGDELKLIVTNTARGSGEAGESLTSVLENGIGYEWENSWIYRHPFARPFMQKGIDTFTDNYLLPTIHEICFNDE